jgi:hypothetical protein
MAIRVFLMWYLLDLVVQSLSSRYRFGRPAGANAMNKG